MFEEATVSLCNPAGWKEWREAVLARFLHRYIPAHGSKAAGKTGYNHPVLQQLVPRRVTRIHSVSRALWNLVTE